ncbi:MAG: homoserine O-acetyltransferase MetX [Planctomycetota bacterium]|jgi:homoserine O-acetyltransferase
MTDQQPLFDPEHSVGFVETKSTTLFEPPNELVLESGGKLGPITVAYETYGELSPTRDNAIFICHALTGDAHVAGWHSEKDRKPGWWDDFVGPGKGLDTNRYFVICANVLAGCKGTTGPMTIDPATGKPYGLRFPFITVGDIVAVHSALVKHLGIDQLLAVVGGSLGGMQVLEWATRFPNQFRAAVCLASAAKLSAQGIAFNVVGRRAILSDPKFNNGEYYGLPEGPRYGLALARMVAHITYLSEVSFEDKFGRRLQQGDSLQYDLETETEFQVGSYLHYQGKRFVERFDANSYLCLTHAMDYFNLADAYGSLEEALGRTNARFLLSSYTTDWLFSSAQSREIVSALLNCRKEVTYVELESSKGHDAFLLEIEPLQRMIDPFLEQTRAGH